MDDKANKGVSGKKVVALIFAGALIMWGALFFFSYLQKQKLVDSRVRDPRMLEDSLMVAEGTSSPAKIRELLDTIPGQWVKVTNVEGQGYAIYIPCFSGNILLDFSSREKILPDSQSDTSMTKAPSPTDSLVAIGCDFCDTSALLSIRRLRKHTDNIGLELALAEGQGTMEILPVNEEVLRSFPEAPFREWLLLWKKPAGDTLFFTPKVFEEEFEVFKAEDENPEGCGPLPDEPISAPNDSAL